VPRLKKLLIPAAGITALALGWTATARSEPPDENSVFHLQGPSEVNVSCPAPNATGTTTAAFELEVKAGPSGNPDDTNGSVTGPFHDGYLGFFIPDLGFVLGFNIPLDGPLTFPAGTTIPCPPILPASPPVPASALASFAGLPSGGDPASTNITFQFLEQPSIPPNNP
jgi:hypothetical protein